MECEYIMDTFLNKFKNIINGTIEGFDRIILKGLIKPIAYSVGIQNFLSSKGVLNKDYKNWVQEQSNEIIQSALNYSREKCDQNIFYISSSNQRKEELVHKHQAENGIKEGLIGVWSCVESCSSFKSTFDANAGFPQLKHYNTRCKHLYFYYDHKDYGFMSIRLQTWAPYNIQIALNGREWLKRSLEKANCGFIIHGNKFLHIDDYDLAQKLLNQQIDTRWEDLLTSFLPEIFPTMTKIFGDNLTYYWTMWQREWARDYIFEKPQILTPLMDDLLRHALITGTSERLLRYMGKPVSKTGQPHHSSKPEVLTRVSSWHEGLRFRHWVNGNSHKCYNEQNVLRFEFTMNTPNQFKVYRHLEGKSDDSSKKLLAMRKGLADVCVGTKVSSERLNCFVEHMATLSDKTPTGQLFKEVSKPLFEKNQRIRALDILGKDLELLKSISDPIFDISNITNKALQTKLSNSDWAKEMSGKQLSGRISRHLKLLRTHGLIRKVANQRKYILTDKGRKLTTALNVSLGSSTEKLLGLVA